MTVVCSASLFLVKGPLQSSYERTCSPSIEAFSESDILIRDRSNASRREGYAEDLIDRLHGEAETDRAALTRTIHDDLGGLMVSAAMDLTSVRQRLPLRPSILDNFGLFAALKWQLKKASEGTSAQLTESYLAFSGVSADTLKSNCDPLPRSHALTAPRARHRIFDRARTALTFELPQRRARNRLATSGTPNPLA